MTTTSVTPELTETPAAPEPTLLAAHRTDQRLVLTISFLFGALAGTSLALLFAPSSGRQTRERLSDVKRRSREETARVIERGRSAIDRTRATVSDQSRHAAQALSEGRAALADIRNRTKQAAGTIGQEMSAALADAKAARHDIRSSVTSTTPDRPPS